MSYPQPYRPQPAYAPVYAAPAPRNGLGTSGFILGLLGAVFGLIPVIGVVAWPLALIGLPLSGVGLSRASKGIATNKGMAIAGLVLSLVALVFCIIWVAALAHAGAEGSR